MNTFASDIELTIREVPIHPNRLQVQAKPIDRFEIDAVAKNLSKETITIATELQFRFALHFEIKESGKTAETVSSWAGKGAPAGYGAGDIVTTTIPAGKEAVVGHLSFFNSPAGWIARCAENHTRGLPMGAEIEIKARLESEKGITEAYHSFHQKDPWVGRAESKILKKKLP